MLLGGCASTGDQNARATRAVTHAAIGAGIGYAATYLTATRTLYGVVAGSSLGLISSWMQAGGYYDY